MWCFAPLAKRAGISALPAEYMGLCCVSSPGLEPYTSFRGIKTVYLGERRACEEVSNIRTSLWKFWAFSVPVVSPAHRKSWEHSWQNVFSFTFRIETVLVKDYKNLTAGYLDYRIPITSEKAFPFWIYTLYTTCMGYSTIQLCKY